MTFRALVVIGVIAYVIILIWLAIELRADVRDNKATRPTVPGNKRIPPL